MKAFGIEQEGRATAALKPGEWLAGVETGLETFLKERGGYGGHRTNSTARVGCS